MIDFSVLSPNIVNALALITTISTSYISLMVGRILGFAFIYGCILKSTSKENK